MQPSTHYNSTSVWYTLRPVLVYGIRVYTTHHEKQALVLILLNGMDHMCVCVMSRSPLLQVNLQVIIIMKMLNSIV
jgi:hypothetical protein